MLKQLAAQLDQKFRRVDLVCFRQLALDKTHVWKLGDQLALAEKVSAWTLTTEIAKDFKGGVPPEGQGYQGIIFEHAPSAEEVVLNLHALYGEPEFHSAAIRYRTRIPAYASGIGLYGDSQLEVVLEVSTLPLSSVYAFGGFSSSRQEIARIFFGGDPSSEQMRWFDDIVQGSEQLGPRWITGDAKNRVCEKMLQTVERLRPFHVD
jgi:hypothetical protein